MKTLIPLMTLVLIQGCGASSGGSDAGLVGDEVKISEPMAAKEKKVTALSVTELPECSDDNLKQLVYHVGESKFYTCEESGWVTIIVQQTVVNNTTVNNHGSMFFKDEVTGFHWYVRDPESTYKACPDSGSSAVLDTIRTPTLAEIREAITNGLFEGVNVKIYYGSQGFIFSNDPNTVLTNSSYTGLIYAFNLCVLPEH